MSAIIAARARAVAIPAGLWLTAIVVCSIVVRVALGHRMVAPWIMVDELVYSELAKNVAAHGEFLVRGVPSHGYGFVYPVLISPAWKLFTSIPDAYAAAKAIDAVLMSLAAIPAYFLARRVLPAGLSLVSALLAVLIPSMLYTGMLMTENAFYPLFLLAAFLLVLTLEAPTAFRQIALLAVCAVAFETRAQAVALFAAAATAPILLSLIERRGARATLRRYGWLYGLLGGGAALALVGTVAAGRSPLSLLGAYRAATSSSYTVSGVLHFFLYHVAELDLYLGIFPFAALLALWLAPRRPSPGARAFAAASLAIWVWLLAEVAAFASASFVNRIEERNTFYLAPLALIALVGMAVDGAVTRRRRVLVAAAIVAGILPFFIPYVRFINTSAVSDTFALMPWWWAQDNLIHLDQVRWAALLVSLVAAGFFIWVPRPKVLVLPALVAVWFVGTAYVVESGLHGIHKTTVGSLWAGTHMPHPNWIDRARRAERRRRRPLDGLDAVRLPGLRERVLQPERAHRLRRRRRRTPRSAPRDGRDAPRRRQARHRGREAHQRPVRPGLDRGRGRGEARREGRRRRRRALPRGWPDHHPDPGPRALPERHLVDAQGRLPAGRLHRRHGRGRPGGRPEPVQAPADGVRPRGRPARGADDDPG